MPNVLIIDDAVDICFLMKYILKDLGIDADYVHTLSDAYISLDKKKYSIILLDNHLPDGIGIEHIQAIKKKTSGCRIVMVTAFDNNENKATAIQRGADLFIGKPFSRETISHCCTTQSFKKLFVGSLYRHLEPHTWRLFLLFYKT